MNNSSLRLIKHNYPFKLSFFFYKNGLFIITLISFIFLTTISLPSLTMAESVSAPVKEEVASVHIVYTDQPVDEELEIFHLRTLSSVFGSEEAAKAALLYTYKHAACGFSAKLTPAQVKEISKRPGVLQVMESKTMQLHESPAKLHNFNV